MENALSKYVRGTLLPRLCMGAEAMTSIPSASVRHNLTTTYETMNSANFVR